MRMRRKAWTEPELANCKFYIEQPSTHRGQWRSFFEKQQPVYLEIGCGKSKGTSVMAYENQDINLIAIDEVRHVIAVSIRNVREVYGHDDPKNLIYSAVNAEYIHDTFSKEDGIERIYINFPNPWDERSKHHKRRLTHPRQLMQYRDFLKDGGEIWFKTDNDVLFEASKGYFTECGFDITYLTDDLHASGFTPNYVTEHEALYSSQGKNIHFLIAKMQPVSGALNSRIENGGNHIMSNFFETNREVLDQFTRVSSSVGARADYVQGGGGNTSAKLADGMMAIKASGYCLKDIRPDTAYAVLNYENLRNFYNNSNPADFADVEKSGSEQAKANTLTIEGLAALRPSVEAGFHSILDKYVAHSHSVYANLATCANELKDIVAKALEGADYSWGWVEYTDPGACLTFSIRDELKRVEAETGKKPAAIFMQNHGLIAHSDCPDECLRIHTDVNDRIAKAFGLNNGDFPAVAIKDLGNGLCEAVCPYLTEQLKSGKWTEKFLLESPLYPDQMVFLIGTFGFGSDAPAEGMAVANPETGAMTFNMAASKAQVIAETITAVLFICETIEKNGYTLSTMGEAAKNFIANWESEKYRKSLAGKK